ncbi:MAG: hypothetical protein WKG00_18960 [Polyangiaceae bacterium]
MHTWSSVPLDALTAGYLFAFVVGAAFSLVSWVLACARRGGRVRAPAGRVAGAARVARMPSTRLGRMAAAAPVGSARAPSAPRGVRGAARGGALSRVCAPLGDTSAWAAMMCVGGGVGYLLRVTGHAAPVSMFVAIPAGLAAGYLLGAMVEMLADDTRYAAAPASTGTVCTVLQRIAASGTGEVMFVHAGANRALPATSANGEAIDPGTEVMVIEIERGIARVTPTSALVAD